MFWIMLGVGLNSSMDPDRDSSCWGLVLWNDVRSSFGAPPHDTPTTGLPSLYRVSTGFDVKTGLANQYRPSTSFTADKTKMTTPNRVYTTFSVVKMGLADIYKPSTGFLAVKTVLPQSFNNFCGSQNWFAELQPFNQICASQNGLLNLYKPSLLLQL